jgi:hypothetical protein
MADIGFDDENPALDAFRGASEVVREGQDGDRNAPFIESAGESFFYGQGGGPPIMEHDDDGHRMGGFPGLEDLRLHEVILRISSGKGAGETEDQNGAFGIADTGKLAEIGGGRGRLGEGRQGEFLSLSL